MKPNENLDPFIIGGKTYASRLLVGTGKYKDFAETKLAIEASGAEIVTVAVRRVVRRLRDARPGMVQTPGQYAAVVAAVRDEAAALMEGLMSTTTTEAKEASPLPVPLGGLLSDEGSGEDD